MRLLPPCRVLSSLALVAICAAVSLARAADVVWTNSAGGNWNTATHWNPNQVPGVFDHAWITNNGIYTVLLTSDVTVGSLTLGSASGTNALGGTNVLVLAGPLVWQGGNISNTVLCLGGGQITGSANKYLAGGKLINSGAMTLGAQILTGRGSVISNAPAGTFDITTSYGTTFTSIGTRGVIYNAGLFRKTGGVGTARLEDTFSNSGTLETRSGTLRLTAPACAQTAGTTRLLTGSLQVDQGYTLWGGALGGSNTFTGNLMNAGGVVSPSESGIYLTNPGPSTAQLTITGSFYQTNGALVIELGGTTPGAESDLLAVSGDVSLGGTLGVCLRPGFSPALNSSYFFVSTDVGFVGCFAALNYPPGYAWLWQLVGPFCVLTVGNIAPVPASVPNFTIPALRSFDLLLTATDAEAPPQTLTWGLYNLPPTNMTISPGGQLHWTPTAAQVGTHQITACVCDNGGGNCPHPHGPCNNPPPSCDPGLCACVKLNLIVSPPLSIQPAVSNSFLLTWPAPADGWLLERTNLLTGAAGPWTPVPPPYQTNGGVISVNFTNAPPLGNQFFRLHRP